jgi:hypothetical protein
MKLYTAAQPAPTVQEPVGHYAGDHKVRLYCDVPNGARLYTTPPAAPAPKGMVLVPKRMTQAMRDVTDQEDWTWQDLLAAAEAITEDEYNELAAAQPEAVQEPVAWSDAKQSELNDWFLSLPTERQDVLLEDKWMLAGAAFLAGKSITPPAAPVHTVVDNEAKSKEKPAETPADTGFERGGQLAPVQDQLAAQGLKEGS